MPKLELIEIERFYHRSYGTYGLLSTGDFHCFTIEPPWKQNVPYHSCIPPGKYLARRGTFLRGGGYPDIELVDVPDRSAIEIHGANHPSELAGCIAPQELLAWRGGVIVGRDSRLTLQALLDALEGDQFWVAIR